MVTTEELTTAELQRLAASLGIRQRDMLRSFRDGNAARRMTWSSDQRVAESLARRKMPLLIQARSTFALTELGRRLVDEVLR